MASAGLPQRFKSGESRVDRHDIARAASVEGISRLTYDFPHTGDYCIASRTAACRRLARHQLHPADDEPIASARRFLAGITRRPRGSAQRAATCRPGQKPTRRYRRPGHIVARCVETECRAPFIRPKRFVIDARAAGRRATIGIPGLLLGPPARHYSPSLPPGRSKADVTACDFDDPRVSTTVDRNADVTTAIPHSFRLSTTGCRRRSP